MRKALTHLLVVYIAGIAVALVDRIPVDAYDIYYLSVGNSEYRDREDNIPHANVSAREIVQSLRRAGAVDGITLKSEQGAYVTRDDVLDALREIASKATAAKDPLVVYYFVGHGASRPDGMHVSSVGNYSRSDPADVARLGAIIETGEIEEVLETQNLSYILILDNCYYYDAMPGLIGAYARIANQAALRGKWAADILKREIGSSLREPAIILYAAKPGQYVTTLPLPSNDFFQIGPLARRLLLMLDEASKSKTSLSVERFLEKMLDSAFDPQSIPGGHMKWIRNTTKKVLIPSEARAESTEGLGEIRRGSGGGASRDQ
jgi:hypothetical protein